MKLLAMGCMLSLLLAAVTNEAQAQLGEFQVGGVVSYGAPDGFGRGIGIVGGLAAGRLTYIGVRWSYFQGATHQVTADTSVSNRMRELAADFGVMLPYRDIEIVPGASLGVLRFRQTVNGSKAYAKEFFVAPGCAVHVHAAGLVIIPEMQVYLPGTPDLRFGISRRGAVGSLRIVIPFEAKRIRV